MGAGRRATAAHDWDGASADFQAAAGQRLTSGDAWMWLGRTLLLDGRTHRVEELAGPWDKALTLGARIMIAACHERTLQPCERGDLVLSKDSVAFLARGTEPVFSTPPSGVEPGKILNNPGAAHVSYSFKAAGKNYAVDFFPPGIQCAANLMVQCPPDGIAKQLFISQYVAQALPKLVSGAYASVPAADPTPESTHPIPRANASQPTVPGTPGISQTDTILIETDSGPVRVKNFYRAAIGKDQFDNVILTKTPSYVITFGAEMMCNDESKRKGCFGIDLTEKAVKADEPNSQQRLMLILGVSKPDFCKLPIAVSIPDDKVTGSPSTRPGVCPNGQFHFLQ
jgi:hypothetical protein